MPKRWFKIEINLIDDTDTRVSTTVHEEQYDDEDQAKRRFGDKDRAARNAGKGSEDEGESEPA